MKAYPIQNTSEFIGKKFTILILRNMIVTDKFCLFEFPLVNTRAYYWLIVHIVFAIVGSFTAIQITFTAHIRGFIAGVLLIRVLIMTEQSCQVAVNEIIYLRYSVANFCP